MYRKPAPQNSLDKRLGLLGTLIFMASALAAIPVMVVVLYAVVYAPFGVAFLVIAGYLTRGRWTPGLRRRVQSFLSVPEITPVLRQRAEPLRPAPVRVRIESGTRSPAGSSADLRDAR